MPSATVNLNSARTRADLAASLSVPEPALDLVSLLPTRCKKSSCALSAAEHNYGRCVLCRQVWFPRAKNNVGTGYSEMNSYEVSKGKWPRRAAVRPRSVRK